MKTITKVSAHALRCGMTFELFQTNCIVVRVQRNLGMMTIQFVQNTDVYSATSTMTVPVTLPFDIIDR